MNNWDQFLNKAANAAQTAASATKRAAVSAKISIAIAAEEDKIAEAYRVIGKQYYQDKTAGAEPYGPVYDQQMGRIEASLQHIAQLRSQRDVTPDTVTVDESDFADVTDADVKEN